MKYYDYEQVPLTVADEAFEAFKQSPANLSILDLLNDLITHCDQWCADHQAYSEQDQRVSVIKKMQAYLYEKYTDELLDFMEADIVKKRSKIETLASIRNWRN